jgi:hypothetical protein
MTSSVADAADELKSNRPGDVVPSPTILRSKDSAICSVPSVMTVPDGIVTVRAAEIVDEKTA